jgi:Golgi SNAP receptor complex protein 1
MTSKVALMGTRFPALNSVLGAVRRKRSKDTLILSSVVAVCLVLILLYRFATK